MKLCDNLTLSVSLEKGVVTVRLVDDLQMLELEASIEVNATTIQSRRYHVREATVIATRRAICEAFDEGLITDSPEEKLKKD